MSDPGYGFVPLPTSVERRTREQVTLDRRVPGALSGAIHLRFVAEQSIHVGSGFKSLVEKDIVRSGARVRGGPGIPGSSLKGALRSRYEAITKSCALWDAPREQRKVISQSHPEVKRAELAPSVRSLDAFSSRHGCDENRMCAACALFGRMSRRARVSVGDFAADGPFELTTISAQFGPRLHHIGDFRIVEDRGETKFLVQTLYGRKFHRGHGPEAPSGVRPKIEVIPRGSRLSGQLRLANLMPAELGGLIAALGIEPQGAMKIGAGNGLGFGRLRLEWVEFVLFDARRQSQDHDVAGWRDAFVTSNDYWKGGEDALFAIQREDR